MNVNKRWIPMFLSSVGEAMIRRREYLVTLLHDGTISCKACGHIVRDSLTKHFLFHQRELDQYLSKQTEEKRVENAEGFYPHPCESCGEEIPRTGKPGRPPRKHDLCKHPVQAQPDDAEIAAELGL